MFDNFKKNTWARQRDLKRLKETISITQMKEIVNSIINLQEASFVACSWLTGARVHELITNKKNLGTSAGFNQGAKYATGYYLCFFNSDYYMNLGWLDSMIECFEHQPNIGLISCATNATGNKDEVFNIIINKYFVSPMQADIPFDYKESYCAIAQMFTTKKIWEEVEGFDEDLYPVEFEDLDFNERIKAKNYKIFVNRKTFGYHDYDKTKSKERKTTRDRNRKIFYKKWGKRHTWA